VDRQGDSYRGWGNPAGAMLAAHMEELALPIRRVKAKTPRSTRSPAEADIRSAADRM
jgi:hypothetical protein